MSGSRTWDSIICTNNERWLDVAKGKNPNSCPWEAIFILSLTGDQADLFFQLTDGEFPNDKDKWKKDAKKPYLILLNPRDEKKYLRYQSDPNFIFRLIHAQTDFPSDFYYQLERGHVYQHLTKVAQAPQADILMIKPEKAMQLIPTQRKRKEMMGFFSNEADIYANEKIEQKIHFYKQLDNMLKKAENLKNRGHGEAYKKAIGLVSKLNNYAEQYLTTPSYQKYMQNTITFPAFGVMPRDYAVFKDLCDKAIAEAREELEKHRGWKKLLLNVSIAILSLGIGHLLHYYVSKNRVVLFSTETDSQKHLNNLSQSITRLKPKK